MRPHGSAMLVWLGIFCEELLFGKDLEIFVDDSLEFLRRDLKIVMLLQKNPLILDISITRNDIKIVLGVTSKKKTKINYEVHVVKWTYIITHTCYKLSRTTGFLNIFGCRLNINSITYLVNR